MKKPQRKDFIKYSHGAFGEPESYFDAHSYLRDLEDYTDYLEDELNKSKMDFDSMKQDKDLWERRYNQLNDVL